MQFLPARVEDIPQIVAMEQIPAFRSFVGSWSQEQHLQTFKSSDARYFVAEATPGEIAGFAILRGLSSEHHSIELKRIIAKTPGQGLGKQMLCFVMEKVFEEFHAHRLWLDVFETNLRAQHVYKALGFRQDGLFREAVYRDGKYHSLLLMSLLDREYRERKQSIAARS